MPFVRVVKRGGTDWFLINPDLAAISAKHFQKQGQGVSVYESSPQHKDTVIASAHYLTNINDGPMHLYVIKLEEAEIAASGIRVELTPGQTKVATVDERHRDLVGTADQFKALGTRLVDAIKKGADRIRIVGASQVLFQIDEFLRDAAYRASDEAKTRCNEFKRIAGQ